jgi:ElaB/YqjD/DUF883 family membrane-anchored ribosome-binding protein
MEHNANDTFGSGNSGESTTGGFGAGTGTTGGASSTSSYNAGSTGTSDASFSRDSLTDASGLADKARNAASTAGDKLADVGSQVRDKAGNLKNSLADALESGAEKLRSKAATGVTPASGSAIAAIADDSRVAQATNQLAGGLQASADWLRDADLDGLKSGIERQVKEHPGRSLAVAVGLGYLLGKAFRNK